MPLPMMVPTTMAVAWLAPSTRRSRGKSSGAVESGVGAEELLSSCGDCEGITTCGGANRTFRARAVQSRIVVSEGVMRVTGSGYVSAYSHDAGDS